MPTITAIDDPVALNDYQAEKMTFYFNTFFDKSHKGFIDYSDMLKLNQRILDYTSWDPKCQNAVSVGDILRNFFECLVDNTHGEMSPLCLGQEGTVTLGKWLKCWARLLSRCKSVGDFPYWMQVLAKMWFLVIDRNEDGIIGHDELETFYVKFVGIDSANAVTLANEGIANMTAKGAYPLDFDLFRYNFGAFFICRNHHGPGKFIFGFNSPKYENQPLIISRPTEEDDNKVFKIHVPEVPRVKIMCTFRGSYM